MPPTVNTPHTRDAAGDWIRRVDDTEPVRALLRHLETDARPLHVHKLTGALRGMVAASVRRHTRRPVLVVAQDEDSADAVRADLELLLDEPISLLAEHTVKPYEAKTPHTDIASARLETMSRLADTRDGMVVTTVPALLERVISPALLEASLLRFQVGEPVDMEDVLSRLTYLGYDRSVAVEEVGDYALRGGILDVYSLGGENPLRIEVEYDEVASIREFDVHTQRSLRARESATVLPRHELVLDQERIDAAVQTLSERDVEAGDELAESFEIDVHPVGIERVAALLGQDLGSFLRFLAPETVVFLEEPDPARSLADSQWEEIETAYETVQKDFPHISAPGDLYLEPDALWEELSGPSVVRLSDLSHRSSDAEPVTVHSRPPESFGRKIELWREYLQKLLDRGFEITIFCDNEGQRGRLHELLVEEGVNVRLSLGVLSGGFVLEAARLVVLTDHEFFGRPRRRHRPRRFRSGFGLKELHSLKIGSYVVHIDHGIGRYLGITRLEVNGHLTDVLQIEYRGNDKVYLPVDQLHLLQKYSSEEGKIPVISRLGGTGWDKAKHRAKKAIKEMAGELLRLYAQRKANPGYAFGPDTPWQQELEGSFPFEETPDQQRAVDEVKEDMQEPSPMDRLICGDVGYGKTEVAVRAAFKAIQEGKQAAMLVPTTILAEQHFRTFQERFGEFPVSVDMLSRFRTPRERAELLKRLAAGQLDMVIGTHALLGKNVTFSKLGLLIVDEEQRFGVAHKEKLKRLKANVDVLTLTATPIPRTLNLSLLGVRDITIIQTPPAGRMPVQTEIAEFDRELIRDALLREADRGGQSFFVHNRVASIQSIAAYVQRLCPQLRVGIGHGQMRERDLEKVMHDFIDGRLDVLVSTMIIENGLDIPSVNTMVVNRADALGLSQLYQLRGRVGRSTQKAFCHFLIPSHRVLTQNAMKRLRAIAEFDELGSGFALAMRDLEIRGSGNILGAEQSGHVVTVGFEMYCRLVDEAVRELKGMPVEDRPEPRLTTDVDAYLPDDYVEDAEEKVGFYKRLAEAREREEVDALQEEIQDRFGKVTPPAEALFDLRRIRLLGGRARASSISIRNDKIHIELTDPPSPREIKTWMKTITLPVEFATSGGFVLRAPGGIPEVLSLLQVMSQPPPATEETEEETTQ